jgi:TolB-like protein
MYTLSAIKLLRSTFLLGTLLFGLVACSSQSERPASAMKKSNAASGNTSLVCVSSSGQVVDCLPNSELPAGQFDDLQAEPIANTHPLTASNNSVMLSEYVEQLATQLVETSVFPGKDTVVGVTSFIEFSTDLSSVNLLGNLLAEEFMFQMQQNGFAVVDYKVAHGVQVAKHGDFVFSRKSQVLNLTDSMQYVLTGTTVYNTRGLVVNARIVHLETKRIVASAQKLIPYFVLDSIVPASAKQSVMGSR